MQERARASFSILYFTSGRSVYSIDAVRASSDDTAGILVSKMDTRNEAGNTTRSNTREELILTGMQLSSNICCFAATN
jgi:hypothetical protein